MSLCWPRCFLSCDLMVHKYAEAPRSNDCNNKWNLPFQKKFTRHPFNKHFFISTYKPYAMTAPKLKNRGIKLSMIREWLSKNYLRCFYLQEALSCCSFLFGTQTPRSSQLQSVTNVDLRSSSLGTYRGFKSWLERDDKAPKRSNHQSTSAWMFSRMVSIKHWNLPPLKRSMG